MAKVISARLRAGFKHFERNTLNKLQRLPAGSVIQMTEERFKSLRDRFDRVTDPTVAPVTTQADKDWKEVLDKSNASDVVAIVNSEDDVDTLKAIAAVEGGKTGKGRVTILRAIEERVEELTRDGKESDDDSDDDDDDGGGDDDDSGE